MVINHFIPATITHLRDKDMGLSFKNKEYLHLRLLERAIVVRVAIIEGCHFLKEIFSVRKGNTILGQGNKAKIKFI